MFPQGSFSLGTVIKPSSDEDDYDIDLVCKLQVAKSDLSQKQLKTLVGKELKSYVSAHNMSSSPEARRRCWRLDYADQDVHFHLDVLPAIPDGVPPNDQTIAITDNQMPDYSDISQNWQRCNPSGYLQWFRKRMEGRLQIMRKELAESRKANIADVPEYQIKTPLQRVIQILKRHRDITYDGLPDDKPISILITTLAARAYNNEGDVAESLQNITMGMREFVEDREGVLWVANPVNPDENFADKWQQYPKRQEAFFSWLDCIEADVVTMFEIGDVKVLRETLVSRFGERAVGIAIKDLIHDDQAISDTKTSVTILADRSEFDVAHKQKPLWETSLNKRVYIKAEVIRVGSEPRKICNGATVEKDLSLRFTAFITAKRPYDVYWQVVNTGQEAREAQCLRGIFYETHIRKGRSVRNESTFYQGRHWIECFIVKNDICVARSGEFVINIL